MLVIDPLKIKLGNLLSNGCKLPLQEAMMGFATPNDIEIILQQLNNVKVKKKDPRRYAYIDITPYERFGHISEFIDRINQIENPRPILLVKSDDFVSDVEAIYKHKTPIVMIKFSKSGKVCPILHNGSSLDSSNIQSIKNDFNLNSKKPKTLQGFRKDIANEVLLDVLYHNECIDIPYEGYKLSPIKIISGRYFIGMKNGMLVSCYINLKRIGLNPSALIDVAYEAMLEVMDYFCYENDPLATFEAIITTNNTSLFLVSTLQAILFKPVIPIDKLGPIPSLQLHSDKLKTALNGKSVLLFEEVISTGNEIDRAIMFLNSLGAKTKKVIGLYDFEIGIPLLVNEYIKQTSLCKPKEELNYVYRSR